MSDKTTPKHEKYNYFPLFMRNENFEISQMEYILDEDGSRALFKKEWSERKFKAGDTEETYRVINSWAKAGVLLDNTQENSSSWRKFSLIDLCWIAVISEARKMGIGLAQLKRLREIIFGFYAGLDGKHPTEYFEFYVLQVLLKCKVSIVILQDGTGDIAFDDELVKIDFLINKYKIRSFYVINLNMLIAQLIKKEELQKPDLKSVQLNDKEKTLMADIRFANDGDEVKVKMQEGEIEKTEIKRQILNPENAVNELREFIDAKGELGTITFKKQDGKIVYVEQIERT